MKKLHDGWNAEHCVIVSDGFGRGFSLIASTNLIVVWFEVGCIVGCVWFEKITEIRTAQYAVTMCSYIQIRE